MTKAEEATPIDRTVSAIVDAPPVTAWDQHEARLAETPPQGDIEAVTLWREQHDNWKHELRKRLHDGLPVVFSGYGDDDTTAQAMEIWECLNDWQRREYCRQAFLQKPHPRVWSKILRASWLRGRVGSLLHWSVIQYDELNEMFRRAVPEHLLEPEELEILRDLPDTITIYRGVNGVDIDRARNGMSWTLDPKIASQFANAGTGNRLLIRGAVNKPHVLAYFTHGDTGIAEQEIIVDSGKVRNVESGQFN